MKRRSKAGLFKKQEFDLKLLEDALEDPDSRKFILKVLNSSEDILHGIRRAFENDNLSSRRQIESPLALCRRRALEGLNRSPSSLSDSSQSSNESKSVNFGDILRNAVCYVEIKSNGKDKSVGARSILQAMGATVSETFTRNVTHVIFKDGSYETYQKAKLLKVHFVSVLWIEASRRNKSCAPEKNYPALGLKNHDLSLICSQMQKEYEDVLEEEVEHSLRKNSPSSFMDKRESNCNDSDIEVVDISSNSSCISSERDCKTPDVIEDSDASSLDSDSVFINGESSKNEYSIDNVFKMYENSQKQQSNSENLNCNSDSDESVSRSLISRKSSSKNDKISKNSSSLRDDKENQAPSASHLIEHFVTDDKFHRFKTPKVNLQKTFLECAQLDMCDNVNNNTGMSPLRISSDSNKQSTGSTVPSLRLSSEKNISSDMSSLRISSEHQNQQRTSTGLSSLMLSTDANKMKETYDNSPRIVDGTIEKRQRDDAEIKNLNSENKICNRSSILISKPESNGTNNPSNSQREKRGNIFMTPNRSSDDCRKRKNETEAENTANSVKKKKILKTNESESDVCEKKGESKFFSQNTPKNDTKNIRSSLFVNTLPRRKRCLEQRTFSQSSNDKENPEAVKLIEDLCNSSNVKNTGSIVILENLLVSPPSNIEKDKMEMNQFSNSTKTVRETTENPGKNGNVRNKRCRKLFDPKEVAEFNQISDTDLNDEEERRRIRLEKLKKSDEKPQKTQNICERNSIFVTEKASEQIRFRNYPNSEKKVRTKKKNLSLLYDSDDEQKYLAREIVDKVPKTPENAKYLVLTQKSWSTIVKNRRSTLEFQERPSKVPKVRTNVKLNKKPTIVCTKMQKSEVELFKQIVTKLGAFEVEKCVSTRTTHLVAGEVKRTINILHAIARGCWILKKEWLEQSLEKGKWLREDDYEAVEFSPAVQKCRLEREAFGSPYTIDIFKECGRIYIAKDTTPSHKDLHDLITICQGKVTKTPNYANIIVGEYLDGLECVTETWILDSISNGKLKQMKKYLIERPAL